MHRNSAKHDRDFRAGFAKGRRASSAASIATGRREYQAVSRDYGIDWIEGYGAALDVKRGAYATKAATRARALNAGGAKKTMPKKTKTKKFSKAGKKAVRVRRSDGVMTTVYRKKKKTKKK
tara:strand:- start:300 stop:662 length:363 start_codon:yes stop_codon:yes gene_type:complete